MADTTRLRSWPRSRRTLLVVLAVVLVLLLSVVGGYVATGRATVLTTDAGHRIIVADRYAVSGHALVTGRLTAVGRCFGLDGNLTVWPHGTEVVADDRVRMEGKTYGIGDEVEGGGAYIEREPPDFEPVTMDVPEGCPVTDVVIVLGRS